MSVRYQPRWPGMTLNGVIALILRFSRNSIALQANYVTVVEDRHRGLCLHNVYMYNVRKYCLPVPVSHFWPKLTHPAARSLCDSWATCSELHTLVRYNKRLFFYSRAILRRCITFPVHEQRCRRRRTLRRWQLMVNEHRLMANTFREVIRGVRRQLIEDLSVTDLLIVDLLDRRVLTDEQYRQLLVRNTRSLTFTI